MKITCIYEGTTEVQQNIISTFRWRTTRRTKGEFYGAMGREMAELHGELNDNGYRLYGLAANLLNEAIEVVHVNRLSRQQYLMFALSEMMTHVEVGVAMARRTARAVRARAPQAEKLSVMNRIFARKLPESSAKKRLRLLSGPMYWTTQRLLILKPKRFLMNFFAASRGWWRIWIKQRILFLRGDDDGTNESNSSGDRRITGYRKIHMLPFGRFRCAGLFQLF